MNAPLRRLHNEWKKVRWELTKNATCFLGQILEVAPLKTAAVWPLNYDVKIIKVRRRRLARYFFGITDELLRKVLLLDMPVS